MHEIEGTHGCRFASYPRWDLDISLEKWLQYEGWEKEVMEVGWAPQGPG